MSAPVTPSQECQFNLYVSFANQKLARLGAYVVLQLDSRAQEIRSQDIFQSTKFEVTIPVNTRMIKATLGALEGATWFGPFAGTDKSLILKDEDTIVGRESDVGAMQQTLSLKC